MRWLVQGTDAITGDQIDLAVNEPQAADAIKSAIDRRIVVTHIRADGAATWRRITTLLAYGLSIALVAACAALVAQNMTVKSKLDEAVANQRSLADAVAAAERTAANIRTHGDLAASASAQIQKLSEELNTARNTLTLTERQRAAEDDKVSSLEQTAGKLADAERENAALSEQLVGAETKLHDSEKLAAQLRGDLDLQERRMDQLEHLPAPADEAKSQIEQLDAANKDLSAQLDALKQQLLVAVAQASAPPATAPDAVPAVPATPEPWALRVSYDTARDYLSLHADHDSFVTQAIEGTPLFASSGVLTANALRIRFVHDRAKEKVYGATLVISLAPDAPKDKAAENTKIIGEFVRTFIPTLQDADAVVAAAGQLSGKDASHRTLIVADDCKITIWGDKDNLFTFQIESARDLLE